MSITQHRSYWLDAMSRRMSPEDECIRLTTVMLGFYFQDIDGHTSPLDFWLNSKRPYGDEDIAESIAFNLGWDWKRYVRFDPMPDWVRNEAMRIHQMVGERLSR